MPSPSYSYPPPVRQEVNFDLLLSDVIAFNWKNNPAHPFFIYSDPEHGRQVISHLEFGRAAHRVAHIVRPDSANGRDGEVVGILARTDTVLYQAVIAGLIIAGYVPFPIDNEISPEVAAKLLIKASCSRVLATTQLLKPFIDVMKTCLTNAGHTLEILSIPSLDDAYPKLAQEDDSFPFTPYTNHRRPSLQDPCLMLHSSGSTGLPKVIVQTHAFWIYDCSTRELVEHEPPLISEGMIRPSYTQAGIRICLFHSAFFLVPVAVLPPTSIRGEPPLSLTPDIIIAHAKAANVNALWAVPILLKFWSLSTESVEFLKQMAIVGCSGSRLQAKIGHRLVAAGVPVINFYAATEFGVAVRMLTPTGSDWEYVEFLDVVDVRWVPFEKNVFECHLLASKTQPMKIQNLSDGEGYATGDLFQPHPTKPKLWKHVGRISEVILHSTGKKTIPGPIEDILATDPLVRAVVLFGHGYDQPGALIELYPDAQIEVDDKAAILRLRDQIWPTVIEANEASPLCSQIKKEIVCFTSKTKPLPRTTKREVYRHGALGLYAEEISEWYKEVNLDVDGP